MSFDRVLQLLGLRSPKIFISYRRVDSGGHASRLLGALRRRFGRQALYLDHESVEGGEQFEVVLASLLERTEILLAVIGPDWLTVEENGARRLDQPGDWVRREVETALERSVTIVPVLVGSATLPKATDLPGSLRPLVERQAVEVRAERFDDDVAALVKTIGGGRGRWLGVPIVVWLIAVIASLAAGFLITEAVGDDNAPPAIVPPGPLEVVAGDSIRIDLQAWADDDADLADLEFSADDFSDRGGIVELNDSTIIYRAPDGYQGQDEFVVTVRDRDGDRASATVFVQVELGPLDGAFNVAVAEFSTAGELSDAVGAAISTSTFEQVATALAPYDSDLGIGLGAPDRVGAVGGQTFEARATAARELAERIDADVIFSGSIAARGAVTSVVIELQISDRNLRSAEELAGAYRVASIEVPSTDPVTVQREVRAILEPQAAALAELAVGLSYYSTQDYDLALARFEAADNAWIAEDARHVILHLLGNVMAQRGPKEYGAARAYYEDAIELEPTYARSSFGLAELDFQIACLGVPPDAAALSVVRAEFERVATLDAPPTSFLDIRARVGAARAELCLATIGGATFDPALQLARSLVDDIGAPTDPRLRELASESHQLTGFAWRELGDYQASLGAYDAAIAISLDEERIGFYHQARGNLFECHLGDQASADAAYELADQLRGTPVARGCD